MISNYCCENTSLLLIAFHFTQLFVSGATLHTLNDLAAAAAFSIAIVRICFVGRRLSRSRFLFSRPHVGRRKLCFSLCFQSRYYYLEVHDLEDELTSTVLEFPDKKLGVNQVEQFLSESPLMHFDLSVFSNDTIKDLFIKFNTPISSSAAVERLFSTGKDVLNPKRGRLTDKHFEMLLCLRKNK